MVVGPTIILIGLSLAPNAVKMSGEDWRLALVSLAAVSLAAAVAVISWGRGLFRLLPVVTGVAAGYALAAIAFSVVGKLGAFLQSIPPAVLGGIMLLLFGTIASVGIQSMIRHKVDLSETRNLVIAGVMLMLGVGGAGVRLGSFSLGGIGLAALVGVGLNLLLPSTSHT